MTHLALVPEFKSLEIDYRRVIARIVAANDDGPIRRIISGRATKPTGTFLSLKAGFRSMPWESINCELPVLRISEVASGVRRLLAQPHRLEMLRRGNRQPLIYIPDLLLEAELSFIEMIEQGVPFAEAAMAGPSSSWGQLRKVIVEVKDDDDPRNEDEDYQAKIRLAKNIYNDLGYKFITIFRSSGFDVEGGDLSPFYDIARLRLTKVGSTDILNAARCIEADTETATVEIVAHALGPRGKGLAKLCALHVRRYLSIDLRHGLLPHARVQLLDHTASLQGIAT